MHGYEPVFALLVKEGKEVKMCKNLQSALVVVQFSRVQ